VAPAPFVPSLAEGLVPTSVVVTIGSAVVVLSFFGVVSVSVDSFFAFSGRLGTGRGPPRRFLPKPKPSRRGAGLGGGGGRAAAPPLSQAGIFWAGVLASTRLAIS
jgi:hypothetical protein